MERDVQYNKLFIRKPINDDMKEDFEIPTLHMILLYCEWFVTYNILLQVSGHVGRRISNYDDYFLDNFNAFLYDSTFADELSRILGVSLFKYASAAIGDGEVAIPLGLAPSFHLFNKGCAKCKTPRFIRSFCLYCGHMHNIGNELSYTYIPPSKSKRSKAASNSSDRIEMDTTYTGKLTLTADRSSANATISVNHQQNNTDTSGRAELSKPPIQNIKTYSLQNLLSLCKQSSTTSNSSDHIVNDDIVSSNEVVEVVEPAKKEIIVIDLVDSSDEDDDNPTKSFASAFPAENVKVKLESYRSPALSTESMTAVPMNPTTVTASTMTGFSISSLVQPNILKEEEEYSEDHSSYGMDVSDEHSLVPVKLEWPAQRMNKYEMAAMRGIAALYKYSQGSLYPGDKLFLMRNLATNCTGLHRIAARCCFKNVCAQWSAAHTSCHGNDNSTSDVMDVVEGTFVLSQLVCPGNPSWAMFQEKTSHTEEKTTANNATSSTCIIPNTTSYAPLISSTSTPGTLQVYENLEGQQESESDFEARIKVALDCSNLKFMIYSLTGDRRYYTLQDESSCANHSETILLTDDVSTNNHNKPLEDASLLTKKARHNQADSQHREQLSFSRASLLLYSEFIDYPDGYTPPPLSSNKTSSTNRNSQAISSSAAAVAVVSKPSSTDSGNHSKRSRQQLLLPSTRNNPLRRTKTTILENLSEEYENSNQFGEVSPEVAKEFMEFTQVRASCKVFIKKNLKFMSLADFLGFDLDRFILPTPTTTATTGIITTVGKTTSDINSDISSYSNGSSNNTAATVKQINSKQSSKKHNIYKITGRKNIDYIGENCIDSKFHNAESYTGPLCWSYITEEIGFDADSNIEKTSSNYQVKDSTLSKVIRKLTHIRIYYDIKHFQPMQATTPIRESKVDFEAYKKQCYLVTHIIYAFSDWGQHALRRELFAEEYEFIVTNMSDVMHILKDPELVGEFLQCLRILQYTPARDPGLVALFTAGLDFLLQVEKELSSMGRWVPTRNAKREDAYTQYHATYCAVVGLVDCNFAKDENDIHNPPTPRILYHLRSEV